MGNQNAKTSNSNNVMTMKEASDFLQSEIASHQVVIFSKSYCPYCQQTKDTFAKELHNEQQPPDVKVHELDQMQNGRLVQQALFARTQQRTVPNVFVNGTHVGGNSDVVSLARSHKLQSMLAATPAKL